jgi:hypothetical protein
MQDVYLRRLGSLPGTPGRPFSPLTSAPAQPAPIGPVKPELPGPRAETAAPKTPEPQPQQPDSAAHADAAEKKREEPVQRKTAFDAHAGEELDTSSVAAVIASGGRPLDRETRGYMESRFGYDFSRVRVHADASAAASARSLRAPAYTVGNDIVFSAGSSPQLYGISAALTISRSAYGMSAKITRLDVDANTGVSTFYTDTRSTPRPSITGNRFSTI